MRIINFLFLAINIFFCQNSEIFKGKYFFVGDELNTVIFLETAKISNENDSLFYSIYEEIKTKELIFSLEKFIENKDVEKYQIIDVVNLGKSEKSKISLKYFNNVLELFYDKKILKKWVLK